MEARLTPDRINRPCWQVLLGVWNYNGPVIIGVFELVVTTLHTLERPTSLL